MLLKSGLPIGNISGQNGINCCWLSYHVMGTWWCQKPLSLEGVPFNVDSRCKVILDLLKSELLLENIKIGLQNANPLYLKSGTPF